MLGLFTWVTIFWVLCGVVSYGWCLAGNLSIVFHSINKGYYTYDEAKNFVNDSVSLIMHLLIGPLGLIPSWIVYRDPFIRYLNGYFTYKNCPTWFFRYTPELHNSILKLKYRI